MIKLFKYFNLKQWLLMLAGIGLIVCQVLLDLKLPDYMSDITLAVQTVDGEINDVIIAGRNMLICAFVSVFCSFIVAVITARIASDFSAAIRTLIFDKVQSFSFEEMNNFSTASLITRSTNDISHIQMLIVMGMQVIFKAPIMAGVALSKISAKSKEWSFTTITAVIILVALVGTCVVITMKKYNKIQDYLDSLNCVTRENITGIQVLRAYNAEDYRSDVFSKVNTKLTNTNMFVGIVMSVMNSGITLVMNGSILALYWMGAYLIDRAEGMDRYILLSDMMVYTSYATQIVSAFTMMVMIFILIPRASVSGRRISEVLDTFSTIIDGKCDAEDDSEASVEFKHVSFRYLHGEQDVLTDISFCANKGETVAFIGSTGCGKSTLIHLIPRFYDVTKGEILVDGVDIREYSLKALRDKIGYVPQKAFLFSGNIKDNILYSEDSPDAEDEQWFKDVMDISCVNEFVDKKEDGVYSAIAHGGTNVSGGQRQRISIARAIYRKPEILIFDDAFSALDFKTDKLVRNALKEKCCDAIKLVVAQRIGTIIDADKIIVLDDGKMAGMGTHEQLMKECIVYQQIAATQLLENNMK